jgi:UPF0755 protein
MVVSFLVAAIAYGAADFSFFLMTPAFPPSAQQPPTEKIVEIQKGMGFSAIVTMLQQEGLIAHRLYFRVASQWTKSDTKLQSGEFAFHTAMRPMEVLDVLTMGRPVERPVTLPEGITLHQIGEILHKTGLIDLALFETLIDDPALIEKAGGEGLEGYLFPTTYSFAKGADPSGILGRMIDQFGTVYDDTFQKRAEALGMTRREGVTLASIIEKETTHPSERALVSAVFHNRLRQGMRLQSDPTVIYGLPNFNGNITLADLSTPSPYNTYVIDGLPPGPIANPGRDALYAALHPADVDFLYFVSKNDGTHAFSRTLSEHNEAVFIYQKQGARVAPSSLASAHGLRSR